jgi:hypothetical protein
MNNTTSENTVSSQLRPLVLLVAAISLSVSSLLITTAALGASPINSMTVAETE